MYIYSKWNFVFETRLPKIDQPCILSSPAYTRMPTCQAPIQQGARKGALCGNETTETYCSKHLRQAIVDKAQKDGTRLCDIARGCFTVLDDHQSKCIHCLHKARINDRKRNDQKRQDPTLCLDCGAKLTEVSRAKGKHDKSLRRCVPCYKKLQAYESQRAPRERNYKAEAFTNKHVLWNHYVKSAQKRGIDFALSKARFHELILEPCFYCHSKKEGEVNGLDRMDNNRGYSDENVTSCCTTCNFLKGSQHPQEFLDKLGAIHRFRTAKEPIASDLIETWNTTYSSLSAPQYKTYTKSANSRNIDWALSEEEFTTIVKQPCYLCGIAVSDTNRNGIDRFDNRKGYRLDNCRPCCGHCNLMKRDIPYETLIAKAATVADRYVSLIAAIVTKDIPIRVSKTAARIKVTEPLVQEPVAFDYKPINEVIVPKEGMPEEIRAILETPKESIPVKQWKSKQIHKIIQTSQEIQYKAFCEAHNTLSSDWTEQWNTFIATVKGQTFEQSEPIIKAFVENLRRLRHNALCAKDPLEREGRQQWPAHTVVKAFLEGKLDAFKAFTEAATQESPEDAKWIKRWTQFISSLELNRSSEETLKVLCSKFMAAQRIKKYRANKSS